MSDMTFGVNLLPDNTGTQKTLGNSSAKWDIFSNKLNGQTLNSTAPIYYVEGPNTDTTAGTWTGSITDLTAYYDGLTITYVPAVATASTTTLNINSLGAITCYDYNNNNLESGKFSGRPIIFVYNNSKWYAQQNTIVDTGWVDISSYALTTVITPTDTRFHIRRIGSIVQLRIRFVLKSALAANTWLNVTSAIPSQFWPSSVVRVLCTASTNNGMYLDVQDNGILRTYCRGESVSANGFLSNDLTYFVG